MPIIYSANKKIGQRQTPEQKKSKRASRIYRRPDPKTIQLTPRRIEELKILYHHRLADTDIFKTVLDGSDQQIRKELRHMYDNGYIDRPIEQWIMHKKYNGGRGRSENIYALTKKGMRVLQEKFDYQTPKTDLDRKNRELGETTIFHDIALTRLWAILKTSLDQKRHITKQPDNLIFWYQDRVDRDNLKTELTIPNSVKKITVVPDIAFKLQCPVSQYLFLVEYYRTRKGGHQNYLNHLKLYNLYYQQQKFKKYGTKKGFRIITMVPTRTIATNLINLINTKEQNKDLRHFRFWFLSEDDYQLYRKIKVDGKGYYKQTKDIESILRPIFRTPIDDQWHMLEE